MIFFCIFVKNVNAMKKIFLCALAVCATGAYALNPDYSFRDTSLADSVRVEHSPGYQCCTNKTELRSCDSTTIKIHPASIQNSRIGGRTPPYFKF